MVRIAEHLPEIVARQDLTRGFDNGVNECRKSQNDAKLYRLMHLLFPLSWRHESSSPGNPIDEIFFAAQVIRPRHGREIDVEVIGEFALGGQPGAGAQRAAQDVAFKRSGQRQIERRREFRFLRSPAQLDSGIVVDGHDRALMGCAGNWALDMPFHIYHLFLRAVYSRCAAHAHTPAPCGYCASRHTPHNHNMSPGKTSIISIGR